MYSFGKVPPRAIDSSGVASVLGEGCRVFYDNLFHTAGIGRVSDLLAARLRAFKLDELKFRAVLLFGFFEAYRAQSAGGALDEPLVVECGIDDEKVAVGISFSLLDAGEFNADGLQERIAQNRASNAFESLLGMIHSNSDHLLVRVDQVLGRVEIISLLAIPGKFELGEKQPLTLVKRNNDLPKENVTAKEYVQLADLEYAKLLQEDSQQIKKKTTFSTGEILSKKFSAPSAEKSATVVKSAEKEEADEVRISADPVAAKNELIRVSGNSFSVQAMLKKVWPFKRKKESEADESLAADAANEGPDASAAQKAPATVQAVSTPSEPVTEKPEVESEDAGDEDANEMAQRLARNLTTGSFSQLVDRTQEMAREIKRDSKDQAAKRWAEGVSQEILAEKIRLGALSQKINQAIRQKELDLRKREQKFAEDLRRKEEAIHQKNLALSRAKEQVAQLTAQIEKQKTVKSTSSEDAGLKHKYQLSQRMISSMREENAKLTAKLEDLKSQTTSSQKTSDSAAQLELANLKTKQDQMTRQNMQLKSLNEQLMRRVGQNSAKAAEKPDRGAVEEMRKKYETASKLSEQQQKELAQLKGKLDKLSKEETRWVTDLAKKEAELRKAKTELEHLQAQVKTDKKAS